jgi:BCD family chlorophyll transporter-like MFS transporter
LCSPTRRRTGLAGPLGRGLAFLLVGAGLHITQTAGLALATDLASETTRPRVVALLYVMLLLGTIGSALLFSWLLADFSYLRLIKVIQGAAIVTIVLNTIALWRQESLRPERTAPDIPRPTFNATWRAFVRTKRTAACCWQSASAPPAFRCRTSFSSPTAARCWA